MFDESFFYHDGGRWEFEIDFKRWKFGIAWSKKLRWIDFDFACFQLTIWSKKNRTWEYE